MTADGRTPDDRLDRFLDRLTGGDGVAPHGQAPDPALAEAARRFHALDDDSAPLPAELARIWEDLMDGTVSFPAPSRPFAPPLGRPTLPNGRHAPPDRVALSTPTRRKGRGWPVTEFAVAAAVLLAVATGYLGYRPTPAPPGGEEAAFGGAVQGGTPVVTEPEACRLEPRPEGDVARLAGERPTIPAVLPRVNRPSDDPMAGIEAVASEAVLAGATAADAETVAAIDATLREINACRFSLYVPDDRGVPGVPVGAYDRVDLDAPFFARYSDDFFRRELAGFREAGEAFGLGYLISPWAPEPPTVAEAWKLPDGRVGVALQTTASYVWSDPAVRDFFVFAAADDRWLVDETGAIGPAAAANPNAAGTPDPTARTHRAGREAGPTFVDLVLRDGSPGPFTDLALYPNAFRAETDVTVALANLGERPHRVEIDALGVSVEVPPGEVREIVINGPAREYLVESYVPNPTGGDRDLQRLSDQLTLVPEGEPIYLG